jgi:hypothetical protein
MGLVGSGSADFTDVPIRSSSVAGSMGCSVHQSSEHYLLLRK